MPWIRQLDSGLWAATVYLTPDPKDRITETHESKAIITKWARKLESDRDTGLLVDPRLGKVTVSEVWELYGDGRRLEKASRKRDASHWNCWVGPKWGNVRVGTIRKPDISTWVVNLERQGHDKNDPWPKVGQWTVIASLALLRSLLEIAVDAGLIYANPARKVDIAPPPKHEDRNLTEDECADLLAAMYKRFPDRPEAGLMCEMMAYCGTRYEEVAALRRTPAHVDMREKAINIFDVMEKDGTIRPYPKSKSGERTLPLDDDLWPRFRTHVMTVPPDGLIFTAPSGGPCLYDNWRKRVWLPGLLVVRDMTEAEKEAWKEQRRADGLRPWKAKWVVETPVLADPQPTPHDLRHLYGTRLVEAGVPKHERRYLMGHKDDRAGIRYENPREQMKNARDAMKAFRKRRADGS